MENENQVREKELARRKAMLAGDAEELTKLVHPSCVYVHSSGFADVGRAMNEKIAAGTVRYFELNIDEEQVTSLDNATIFVYRQRAKMQVGGASHSSLSKCTAVWLDNGSDVQLVSFHSASLPDAQ